MNLPNFRNQRGQGMTEYIIIVALIAVVAIGAFRYFGQTARSQVAAAAQEVAGTGGAAMNTAAIAEHLNGRGVSHYLRNTIQIWTGWILKEKNKNGENKMLKILVILFFLFPFKAFSNLCSFEYNFYLLNKGVGLCVGKNTYIKQLSKEEYKIYDIFYNGQNISLEFSGRIHGEIFLFYGMNFEKLDIKKSEIPLKGKPIELLTWNIDGENYYSASIFSDGYSNVFVQSNYKKDFHDNMIHFMQSLLFVDNKSMPKVGIYDGMQIDGLTSNLTMPKACK